MKSCTGQFQYTVRGCFGTCTWKIAPPDLINSLFMIVYTGPLADSRELIQFVRRESMNLRALRKLVITPEKTVVRDVNGDTMEFPGLTYGNTVLDVLLEELGVIFTASTLHDPAATPSGVKEFRLSARHPWGHDRVM